MHRRRPQSPPFAHQIMIWQWTKWRVLGARKQTQAGTLSASAMTKARTPCRIASRYTSTLIVALGYLAKGL